MVSIYFVNGHIATVHGEASVELGAFPVSQSMAQSSEAILCKDKDGKPIAAFALSQVVGYIIEAEGTGRLNPL